MLPSSRPIPGTFELPSHPRHLYGLFLHIFPTLISKLLLLSLAHLNADGFSPTRISELCYYPWRILMSWINIPDDALQATLNARHVSPSCSPMPNSSLYMHGLLAHTRHIVLSRRTITGTSPSSIIIPDTSSCAASVSSAQV